MAAKSWFFFKKSLDRTPFQCVVIRFVFHLLFLFQWPPKSNVPIVFSPDGCTFLQPWQGTIFLYPVFQCFLT